MKRNLLLLLSIIIVMVVVSCSKDGDSSSPTGIDFTNQNWLDKLDYYLLIDSSIDLMVRDSVETCEFIINDIVIDTQNWYYDEWAEEDGWFSWSCYFEPEELPEALNISPGTELVISLNINGNQYSTNLKVPFKANASFPEFDLTKDYNFSWELSTNPMAQMVWFGCENGEDYAYGNYQLSADKRSYTIQKSVYSDFIETGVDWFEIGIDGANYKDFGKCIFLSAIGESIDEDEYRSSDNKQYKQMLKWVIENR